MQRLTLFMSKHTYTHTSRNEGSKLKTFLLNSIYIFWASVLFILFIFFSGTICHLYGSTLKDLPQFGLKILQIDFVHYFKDLLIAFFGIAFFTFACVSLGSFLTTWEHLSRINDWTGNFVSSFLVGEIAYSIVFYTFAYNKLFTPINTGLILLAGGVIGIHSLKTHFSPFPKTVSEKRSRLEILILMLAIAIIASTALFTSTRISYDSTGYYFSNAELTAINNRLSYFSNDPLVAGSFHSGILYAAIIQIFGDQAARFLSWINGVLMILICITLAKEIGLSNKGIIFTLAMLTTSTALMDPFGDGKIELAMTLPALTAIYWLVRAEKSNKFKQFFLAGIFAGFSIISRPYNFLLIGGFFSLYFLAWKDNTIFRIKPLLFTAFGLFLMLGFHLAANWALHSNPLAPLTMASKANPNTWQWSGFNPENIFLARTFYPFLVAFFNTPQSMGNVSPLFLIFLPLLIAKETRNNISLSREAKKITVISVVILFIWIYSIFTIFEIRYVFFLWVIFFIGAADMFVVSLEHSQPMVRNFYSGSIVLLLGFILLRNLFIAVDAYAPIDNNNNPQCSTSIFCNYLYTINDNASQGERVFNVSAFRYYLRRDLFACSSSRTDYLEIQDAMNHSTEKFWLEVHRQGYTYIAYEKNYSLRHLDMDMPHYLENPPNWVKLEQLSNTFDGYFATYKIEYIDASNQIVKRCEPINGIWTVQDIP